jgi:cytochrome c-type biogenesis protein CcmH/NrfG
MLHNKASKSKGLNLTNSTFDLFSESAIQLDPKATDQHYSLGTILEDRNELSEALEAYETELTINPKKPDRQQQITEVQKKMAVRRSTAL